MLLGRLLLYKVLQSHFTQTRFNVTGLGGKVQSYLLRIYYS